METKTRPLVEELHTILLKEAGLLKKWLNNPADENVLPGLIEGMQDLVRKARAIDKAEFEADEERAS